MALVWIGVLTLRALIFVLVLAFLLISSLLQWRVRSNNPASTLVSADPRTVLVLRPFGGDGRLVLHPNVLNVSDGLVHVPH